MRQQLGILLGPFFCPSLRRTVWFIEAGGAGGRAFLLPFAVTSLPSIFAVIPLLDRLGPRATSIKNSVRLLTKLEGAWSWITMTALRCLAAGGICSSDLASTRAQRASTHCRRPGLVARPFPPFLLVSTTTHRSAITGGILINSDFPNRRVKGAVMIRVEEKSSLKGAVRQHVER